MRLAAKELFRGYVAASWSETKLQYLRRQVSHSYLMLFDEQNQDVLESWREEIGCESDQAYLAKLGLTTHAATWLGVGVRFSRLGTVVKCYPIETGPVFLVEAKPDRLYEIIK